ncbi:ATP-dependent RecD-like DNA helicase [Streptomyces microflavus]
MSNMAVIEGVLERITYANEENGYTVARVDTGRGAGDLLTVVGALLGAQVGESLRMEGRWGSHSQYGKQFTVENYTTVLPATIQGIRRYLGSGLIKGIGPVMADRITTHFGVDTLDIIENEPKRLVEVPGLGPKRTKMIAAAWEEQKAIKEVMVFLQGVGVSTSIAVRIYKKYEDASISVVKNQPYRLAADVWGIGFLTADKIAQAVGIPHDGIGKLRANTGLVTLDSGYGNTAAYKSAITYLDGGTGHSALPRIPIEQLAERSSFLEVAYTLINGDLPKVDELRRPSRTRSPSTRCCTRTSSGSSTASRVTPTRWPCCPPRRRAVHVLPEPPQPYDKEQRRLSTIRLLAKLPTIAAYAYKKSIGHPFVYPRNDLGYVENFLRMTFSVPAQEYELDTVGVSALDKPLILHAATNRTARPPPCVWSAPRRRTCSPRSPPASRRCGAPCTVAPTSRCWRCWKASRPTVAMSTPSSAR